MVTRWELALLPALLAVAAVLVVALLLCSWWHGRQAVRTERLERTVRQLLTAWAERSPTPEELDRLAAMTAAERRVLLGCCMRELPGLEPEAQARVRDVMRRSTVLEREVARLRHRSPAHRAEACRILGRLGQHEAVPLLVERLRDPDTAVRREAIAALADLRAVEALGAVARALEAAGEWGNLLAIMSLVRMGPGSAPQFGALLESAESVAMTKALLQVTGQLGVAADPSRVRALAAHAEMEIRVEAVRALGSAAPDPESVTVCMTAMDDPEWPVRALAAWSLGRLHDERAVPRLERAMGDSAYWVRHHVAGALAELGEAGEAALTRGLGDANPFVRDMAAQALFMRSATRGEAA